MACPDRLDRALSLLLPPAFWLGVWQLGAWLVELHVEGRGNELLLPYPATVLLALFRLARSPEFWWTALASLARIAAGMAGGAVLGGLLAALTCTSPWCRRLALVRALALGGQLYLLDEPFTGVDPARVRRLMDALRALDAPVLLSSHETLACSLADQVICLDGPPLRLAKGQV